MIKYIKKYILIISIALLLCISLYIVTKDNAVYVNSSSENNKILANGIEVDTFPSKLDGYVFDKVECANGLTGVWDEATWSLSLDFDNAEGCIVYFVDSNPDDLEAPVLDSKMVAVTVEDDGTVKVADENTEYYAYNISEWANAVIVNNNTYLTAAVGTVIPMTAIEQMYVWIPRYEYKKSSIVNAQESIEINFVPITTVNTDIENNDVIVHPAFTFGEVEQAGIWVGKFEYGEDNTIKPNQNSIHLENISTLFNDISNSIVANSMDVSTDVHMIKNIEWGAIAYLSQSRYGICEDAVTCSIKVENNNYYNSSNWDIVTGCGGIDTVQIVSLSGIDICPVTNRWETNSGVKASTTHNITGVYDMAGGRFEYVMGNMQDDSGNFYSASADFASEPDVKYYDSYVYGSSNLDYSRGLFGDATSELNPVDRVNSKWNDDFASFISSSGVWFLRGGRADDEEHSGIFYFGSGSGGSSLNRSTRSVISFN